jgi:glycosyltransferase involved in cell wall biosynthesis
MTEARPSIVVTTRTLGSSTGVSQVALDLLLALRPHARELHVRAWVPRGLPRAVDGRPLARCEYLAVPPLMAARAVVSGQAPPRALPEQLGLAAKALVRRLLAPLRAADVRARPATLEVVNGLGAHALYRLAQASRADGPPAVSVLLVHESPRHFVAGGRIDPASAREALREYDHCVFVSERVRAEWLRLAALDPARTRYIPNCVRESRVQQLQAHSRERLRRRFGYRDEQVRVVCVGSVSARKGQDLVLEALRALALTEPQLQVDFLGSLAGDFAARLVAGLRGTALAARARFLGNRADVYERMFAADALVLASRAEAAPLSVLEAMALGTCVVAADVDGVSEQLVHGESGLLFAREDVAGLSAALRQITREPALRERLARAARTRYFAEFSRDRQLARWSDALGGMLERR